MRAASLKQSNPHCNRQIVHHFSESKLAIKFKQLHGNTFFMCQFGDSSKTQLSTYRNTRQQEFSLTLFPSFQFKRLQEYQQTLGKPVCANLHMYMCTSGTQKHAPTIIAHGNLSPPYINDIQRSTSTLPVHDVQFKCPDTYFLLYCELTNPSAFQTCSMQFFCP